MIRKKHRRKIRYSKRELIVKNKTLGFGYRATNWVKYIVQMVEWKHNNVWLFKN